MSKKLDIKEANALAVNHDGKCLSTIYQGIRSPLQWTCANGHVFERTLFDVKYLHYWCLMCSGRHTETDYITWATNINATYLGVIKVKGNKKIKLSCNKANHMWNAWPSHTKNGHGCPECAGLKPLTITDAHNIASSKGGRCLSTEYKNANAKLEWQCDKGHIWKVRLASIKDIDTWCPECANIANRRWTKEDAIEAASKQKGKLLSDVFTTRGTKYEWECKKNHRFLMEFDAVLKGRWCPKCKFKAEQKVRELFEKITNEKFPQKGPQWLVNPKTGGRMKLDGYCEKLKLAFEYDGEFHFQESTYWTSTLKERQERDLIKDQLCIDNNISLIRVAYSDDIEKTVPELIDKIIKLKY